MKIVNSAMIVDDSDADVYLSKHFMKKTGRFKELCSVTDGQDALEMFLDPEAAKTEHGDCFPPTVLLLDINMPRMTGFEFLEEAEKLPAFAGTVVVMVSSSSDSHDKNRAAQFKSVQGFLTKPVTTQQATDLAEKYGTEGLSP